jgi:hypothetical protein
VDGTVITLPGVQPRETEPELIDFAFVPPDRLRDYANEPQAARIESALAVLADPAAPRYCVQGRAPETEAP